MLSKFKRNSNDNDDYVPYLVSYNDLTWPYCVGAGYVISSDLLAPLVLASRHYPSIVGREDWNIGLTKIMLNVTPYRYHTTPPFQFTQHNLKLQDILEKLFEVSIGSIE